MIEDVNDTQWRVRLENAAKALGLNAFDPETNGPPAEPAVANTMEGWLRSLGIFKSSGIEILDDDDAFKFGDFRELLGKRYGVAQLRLAFKFLKGGKRTEDRQQPDARAVQLKEMGYRVKLEDADAATLLRMYMPDKLSDPVTAALKSRYSTKPVIAFKDDGSVAVEESVQYLADLEQGYPEQESTMVDGKLARLWPVGVRPNVLVDEDPLYAGVPLRNGCSTVNNRNWTKISTSVRQFCRILAERREINVDDRDAVLRLLERAAGTVTSNGGYLSGPLVDAYPETYLDYRERRDRDQLPKLKVQLGDNKRQNNPFGIKRQY